MRREQDVRVSGVLRGGLVVLAVFAATWACAILWWRSSGAAPGGTAMFAWLLLVPLALLAILWTVLRLRRRAAARAEAGDGTVADDSPADQPLPPPPKPLGILAQAVNLACGDDAAAIATQLPGLPRPGLHPSLRDRDGLPVLAAFQKDLETSLVEDQLSGGTGRRPIQEHLRALALLEPVALGLFEAAALQLPPLPEVQERVVAGLRRRIGDAPDDLARVHVTAILPQDMPSALRDAAGAWLRELAADVGLDPRRSTFEVVAAADAGDVWQRVQGLSAGQAVPADAWHLLLASASLIGERGVQALAAQGRLASGSHIEGVVPGEGAAGVLLRPHGATLPQDAEESGIGLLAIQRQQTAGGVTPRQAAQSSAGLLEGVLASTTTPAADVAMVLTDADQRPSRSVEAAVAAANTCPELDPATQCPALGNASGCLGHVAPLALIALAAAAAREADAPVAVLSVEAAGMRHAALLGRADAIDESLSSDAGPGPDVAA